MSTRTGSLDGPEWRIALDPGDVGRDQKWCDAPRGSAKPATVPCAMQEVFGACSGLAWYWREFAVPVNPNSGGRILLRFWKVDYKADVWVNGKLVGTHEDGDEPFVLDATDAVRPQGNNLLVVRVLNPDKAKIDGIDPGEIASGIKDGPPCRDWNFSGILDSVELLVVPQVYIDDLYLVPNWKTGEIDVRVNIRNSGSEKRRVRLNVSVAPANAGSVADEKAQAYDSTPGDTLLKVALNVPQHRLWELDDPFLYRVTARLLSPDGGFDERSDRCGFRDFRFEKGCFRLNDCRIFLRSAHIVWSTPVLIHSARDRQMLRKDVLYAKTMGFNAIRYLPYAGPRCQLELADELGVMVMQQSMGGWSCSNVKYIGDERFHRSVLGIVRRDRNHPCIVLWYILNEISNAELVKHAVDLLPRLREVDNHRVCLLNSGRFDDNPSGGLSNPGSLQWEPPMSRGQSKPTKCMPVDSATVPDWHYYVPVPHDKDVIHALRNGGGFLSEYGIGAALNLPRLVRQFEQMGAPGAMDATYYRTNLDRFMNDWKRWNLAEIFGRPEDYFDACQRMGATHRTLGLNAIRSNPKLIGYSMTGLFDHVGAGEGPITMFRDLKPGHVDAMRDGWAPLRMCLFTEPYHVYRGGSVRIEVVLANEDVVKPGEYGVEVAVFGPDEKPVFRKTVKLTIPSASNNPPFALPVFTDDLKITGAAGRYRLTASFVSGAAPAGESVSFFVSDAACMPAVKSDIALWGQDESMETWLRANGIRFHSLADEAPGKRETILVVGKGGGGLANIARHMAGGSTVILLSPTPWPRWPLFGGELHALDYCAPGLYHRDDWVRKHPIFDGLPAGGLMDWTFYRNIATKDGQAIVSKTEPDEPVCGGINTVCPYRSGFYLGVFKLGTGRFIANALNIRPNLGVDPVAERLLRNMLNYAAQDSGKALTDLPANFVEQIKVMGYA